MTQQNLTKYLWNKAAKPCDFCATSAATLFCRTHAAFTCMACDARVHEHARDDKHARVWICEVCEQAPSVVTCKADAASLCVTCDRDIHSANPLARRHERVPVVPFYDTAESEVIMSSTVAAIETFPSPTIAREMKQETCVGTDDYMPDSWIFNNPTVPLEMKYMDFLLSDSDQFLEFDNYGMNPSQPYSDSVVPEQTINETPFSGHFTNDFSSENRFEIDFTRANISSYNTYTTPSLSVSSSSIDVGVVPDNNAFTDTSYTFGKNPNPLVDSGHGLGLDREARVLRYRKKRKKRKFEKTVRYASRKAYAETRPRIKGRFAKKTDTESDIERMFARPGNFHIAETGYNVVPSF